ncbi:hypothetical protein [Xanthobacter sediminis]
MPMMRPRKWTLLSFRPSFRPLVLAAVMAGGLTGCTGDAPLSLPVPPRPDVPEVATDSYPSVGAPERTGRPVLTDTQRAKLQGDLERLSKDNAAKVQTAPQSAPTAGN